MLALIEEELRERGIKLPEARVAVLGVSYLENADDTRNTPAAPLALLLLARGAEVVAHDPYVRAADWRRALGNGHCVPLTADLEEALTGVDCAAIVTKHREYFDLAPQRLRMVMRSPIVVDGRNVLNGEADGSIVRILGKG
jgi:UDPglucose 6-dehydrogenase